MLIFVDVDGPCANLMSEWLYRYNHDWHDNLTVSQITEWDMAKFVKPECGQGIYNYLSLVGLYKTVNPTEGALDAINNLRSLGHRIVFATSTPGSHAKAKLDWLVEHKFLSIEDVLPGNISNNYVEIHDKSLLRGDVLIDDGPHNVSGFVGLAILFDAPHNYSFDWPVRCGGWNGVLMLLSGQNVPIGTHPTELKSPQQTRAFREIIESMYRVHLDKNFDYSPANILATGMTGLVTRLWDKVARYCNLNGRTVEVVTDASILEIMFEHMKRILWMTGFVMPLKLHNMTNKKSPRNEPIDDSLMDMAVYGIIGRLLRMGKWGK